MDDDELTSRRRGSRARRDFRRGLRITSACPWRNSWDHPSNKCQFHVQRNYWHSKKSSIHNCSPSKYSDHRSESPRTDTENVRRVSHWPNKRLLVSPIAHDNVLVVADLVLGWLPEFCSNCCKTGCSLSGSPRIRHVPTSPQRSGRPRPPRPCGFKSDSDETAGECRSLHIPSPIIPGLIVKSRALQPVAKQGSKFQKRSITRSITRDVVRPTGKKVTRILTSLLPRDSPLLHLRPSWSPPRRATPATNGNLDRSCTCIAIL
jgi:hypothetical protein